MTTSFSPHGADAGRSSDSYSNKYRPHCLRYTDARSMVTTHSCPSLIQSAARTTTATHFSAGRIVYADEQRWLVIRDKCPPLKHAFETSRVQKFAGVEPLPYRFEVRKYEFRASRMPRGSIRTLRACRKYESCLQKFGRACFKTN